MAIHATEAAHAWHGQSLAAGGRPIVAALAHSWPRRFENAAMLALRREAYIWHAAHTLWHLPLAEERLLAAPRWDADILRRECTVHFNADELHQLLQAAVYANERAWDAHHDAAVTLCRLSLQGFDYVMLQYPARCRDSRGTGKTGSVSAASNTQH